MFVLLTATVFALSAQAALPNNTDKPAAPAAQAGEVAPGIAAPVLAVSDDSSKKEAESVFKAAELAISASEKAVSDMKDEIEFNDRIAGLVGGAVALILTILGLTSWRDVRKEFLRIQKLNDKAQAENKSLGTQREQLLDSLRGDPTSSPAKLAEIQAQIEALTQTHADKLSQINAESSSEMLQDWNSKVKGMQSSWSSGIIAMMNGTMTFSTAIKRAWNSLITAFQQVVADLAAKWILKEVQQTTATLLGTAQRVAAERLAGAQSLLISGFTAAKEIMIRAYQAMAGAYAAISAIPYVGPFLAPAVAATTFAGVAVLANDVASAEGGWDLPSGGPFPAVLHSREMVLPRAQADKIRNMTDQPPVGPTVNFYDHSGTRTPQGIADMRSVLAKMARSAFRAGAHVGGF